MIPSSKSCWLRSGKVQGMVDGHLVLQKSDRLLLPWRVKTGSHTHWDTRKTGAHTHWDTRDEVNPPRKDRHPSNTSSPESSHDLRDVRGPGKERDRALPSPQGRDRTVQTTDRRGPRVATEERIRYSTPAKDDRCRQKVVCLVTKQPTTGHWTFVNEVYKTVKKTKNQQSLSSLSERGY